MIVTCTPSGPVRLRLIQHEFLVVLEFDKYFDLCAPWSSVINVNPLSPKSDQHEISPHNINALENRVVMRIEYMNPGRWV